MKKIDCVDKILFQNVFLIKLPIRFVKFFVIFLIIIFSSSFYFAFVFIFLLLLLSFCNFYVIYTPFTSDILVYFLTFARLLKF